MMAASGSVLLSGPAHAGAATAAAAELQPVGPPPLLPPTGAAAGNSDSAAGSEAEPHCVSVLPRGAPQRGLGGTGPRGGHRAVRPALGGAVGRPGDSLPRAGLPPAPKHTFPLVARLARHSQAPGSTGASDARRAAASPRQRRGDAAPAAPTGGTEPRVARLHAPRVLPPCRARRGAAAAQRGRSARPRAVLARSERAPHRSPPPRALPHARQREQHGGVKGH